MLAQQNGLSDDRRVAAEIPLPQTVAQHHHRVASHRFIFAGQKPAPPRDLHSNDIEIISADRLPPYPLRLALPRHACRQQGKVRRDARENAAKLFLIVLKHGIRESRAAIPDQTYQPLRLFHRQIAEQDFVDHCEDRGVCGDPQADRNHHHGHKAGAAAKPAQRVANILQQPGNCHGVVELLF